MRGYYRKEKQHDYSTTHRWALSSIFSEAGKQNGPDNIRAVLHRHSRREKQDTPTLSRKPWRVNPPILRLTFYTTQRIPNEVENHIVLVTPEHEAQVRH